jgi:hypothetical protein
MLASVTAILEPAGSLPATAGHHPTACRSFTDRDEYGPITGRPGGLFTATAVPLALDPRDELGRIATWVPDGDLL